MWIGIFPLIILTGLATALRPHVPAWIFMWTLAAAIFFGCKWLSFWDLGKRRQVAPAWKTAAYLFAWPGMDAETFLLAPRSRSSLSAREWAWAMIPIFAGAVLFWIAAGEFPDSYPLVQGWVGMLGLIFMLHFGSFQMIALFWRRQGIPVEPLMDHPLRAHSLSDFWGNRWNRGFRNLAHRFVFSPLRPFLGIAGASFAVFIASGLIHDLVISWPAGTGYGLPTLYFVIQGLGVLWEKSSPGRRLGFGAGTLGWLWMALVTAAPAYWLFHPGFVHAVILPMMRDLGALTHLK